MTSRILTTCVPLVFAATLVPDRSFAQTSPTSMLGVFSSDQCQCPVTPTTRRAGATPSREIGVKLAAVVPLTGPGFSYARRLNDAVALEGALDFVSLGEDYPQFGLALAQMRVGDDTGSTSQRFLTAGVARFTGTGRHREWLGLSGVGLAVGGGRQHLISDRAGMRLEFQIIRFEQAPMFRATLGLFFGIGE